MQHRTINGEAGTQEANSAQMAEEIRNLYGNDFTYVLQASWNYNHTLIAQFFSESVLIAALAFLLLRSWRKKVLKGCPIVLVPVIIGL